MEPGRETSSRESKPFAVWVIAGGVIVVAVLILGYMLSVPFIGPAGPAYYSALPFFVVFSVVLFVPGYFAWREKRWAYLATTVVCLVILSLFSPWNALSNPADGDFQFYAFLVPMFLLVAGFGILAFRYAKTGLRQNAYLASVRSLGGLVTFATIGFIIGMIVAGTVGAGIIRGNISNLQADVQIVPDAINVPVSYSPNVLTVSVGDRVTWINMDGTAHTVTSNPSGQFDSGIMTTSLTWSFTFTQAGTYSYFCTLHPQMTGTIVVQ